jgi:hypothetical protein
MELWMDNQFVGRKTITNQTIYQDYNGDLDLTLGWSPHNYRNNSYYTGCIYQTGFDYGNMNYLSSYSFYSSDKAIQIPVLGTGMPKEIKLTISK